MQQPVRIIAGALFDGTGSAVERLRVVEVRDGLISGVNEFRDDALESDGYTVIDARQMTLLPGLINAHEHLSFKRRPGSVAEMLKAPSAYLVLQALQNAHWDLERGITTVRSAGDKDFVDVVLRRAIEAGVVRGPRIVAAGPPLVMTGGHGYPLGWEVDGADGFRRAARALLKEGSDYVKLIASGGVAGTKAGEQPIHPELTVEEMAAAVDEAHKAGRKVAAHAHGPVAIANVLDAGVDSVEHGTLITSDLAARMADEGVYLVPTLSQIHQFATRGVELGKPKSYQESALAIVDDTMACFQHAIRSGVRIVAGTDGVGDLIEEVGIFVQSGMSVEKAIHCATGQAASLLGLNVGTISVGAAADLILVDGDVSRDVDALRATKLVMLGGEVVLDVEGRGGPSVSSIKPTPR